MATLSSDQKRFIVQRLAVYDRPSDVRDALREEFGVTVDLSQLSHYDPTTRKGRKLAADLKELFQDTRRAFVDRFQGVAIRHKAVRLRRLERIADAAASMRNYRLEMDALEQAAKELGGAYTDHRTVDLHHAGTLSHSHNIDFSKLTDDQLQRILRGEDPGVIT